MGRCASPLPKRSLFQRSKRDTSTSISLLLAGPISRAAIRQKRSSCRLHHCEAAGDIACPVVDLVRRGGMKLCVIVKFDLKQEWHLLIDRVVRHARQQAHDSPRSQSYETIRVDFGFRSPQLSAVRSSLTSRRFLWRRRGGGAIARSQHSADLLEVRQGGADSVRRCRHSLDEVHRRQSMMRAVV
jgi:hypothetical protein